MHSLFGWRDGPKLKALTSQLSGVHEIQPLRVENALLTPSPKKPLSALLGFVTLVAQWHAAELTRMCKCDILALWLQNVAHVGVKQLLRRHKTVESLRGCRGCRYLTHNTKRLCGCFSCSDLRTWSLTRCDIRLFLKSQYKQILAARRGNWLT